MKTMHRPALLAGMILALSAPASAAQQGAMLQDLILQDPLEVALDQGEAFGLDATVLDEIRAAHEASVERTREEREAVAPLLAQMRERMEAAREGGMAARQGQGMQNRQGARMQGQGMQGRQNRARMEARMENRMENRQGGMMAGGAMVETRASMEVVQAEFRSSLQWLEAHLEEDALKALQEMVRPARVRPTR